MSAGEMKKDELMQQHILKAARQLFQQYGRDKVTMDDVATAVGRKRSSIYYYYKNKEEIWDAVMELEIEAMLGEINDAVAAVSSVEDKLRAFCATKLRALRKRRTLYVAIHKVNDPDTQVLPEKKVTYSIRRKYLDQEGAVLSNILTEGIKNGSLRPIDKRGMEVLVFILISGLHGLEKEIIIEKNYNAWLNAAIDALCHTLIHGLKKA